MNTNTIPDKTLERLRDEIRSVHGCHTVILYGSRARGDARPSSDYDVLGVRESGEAIRDARPWEGSYLDAFIYPESKIACPDETQLQMRGGLILCQKEELGTRFLARLEEIFAAGPKPLAPDEIHARRVWAEKMLARAREGDIEGNFRRMWLHTALLEDFFLIRGQWYGGSKQGLRWLKEHRPELYDAFDAAFKPGSDLAATERLVRLALAGLSG